MLMLPTKTALILFVAFVLILTVIAVTPAAVWLTILVIVASLAVGLVGTWALSVIVFPDKD